MITNIINVCTNELLLNLTNEEAKSRSWDGDMWHTITLNDGSSVDINLHNQTPDRAVHLCAYPVIRDSRGYHSTDTLHPYFESYQPLEFSHG